MFFLEIFIILRQVFCESPKQVLLIKCRSKITPYIYLRYQLCSYSCKLRKLNSREGRKSRRLGDSKKGKPDETLFNTKRPNSNVFLINIATKNLRCIKRFNIGRAMVLGVLN